MDLKDYALIKKANLTDIGDAIREKEGSAELIPPLEMPARIEALGGEYDEGYADGAASVPKYNEWGNLYLFSLNVFTQREAVLNLPRSTTLNKFLYVKTNEDINTTVEHLTINCPNAVVSILSFLDGDRPYLDNTLKKLTLNVDTSQATRAKYAFFILAAVEEIDGTPLDLSGIPSDDNIELLNFFQNAINLREVRFKGSINTVMSMNNKKLSKNSMLSLVPCLSDEAAGKTLSVSHTAVNAAFETSEGAADGSTSEEWTALVESKPNWTIALLEDLV